VTQIVFATLVVAFATLVTVHITLAFGLARRPPRWRGFLALVVAPLAPWWGWQARMRVRGALWVAAAAMYGIALAFSLGS
jgi:hypothetical protein